MKIQPRICSEDLSYNVVVVAFLSTHPQPHGCCNHQRESRHGLRPRAVSRGWTVTVPRSPTFIVQPLACASSLSGSPLRLGKCPLTPRPWNLLIFSSRRLSREPVTCHLNLPATPDQTGKRGSRVFGGDPRVLAGETPQPEPPMRRDPN